MESGSVSIYFYEPEAWNEWIAPASLLLQCFDTSEWEQMSVDIADVYA